MLRWRRRLRRGEGTGAEKEEQDQEDGNNGSYNGLRFYILHFLISATLNRLR